MRTSDWISVVIAFVFLALSYWAMGFNGAVLGGIAGTAVGLLVFVVTNFDRAMKLSSYFLEKFSVFDWAERRSVSNRIQGMINEYASRFNSETNGILPYGIQIEWVDPSKFDRDSFVKQGQVIVRLDSHTNEAKNLSHATWLYVQESLIPDSRKYVDATVMRASDFTVVRKILTLERRNDALRYFNEALIRPEVEKSAEIEKYMDYLQDINGHGFFTRILLREFLELGPKLYPSVSDPVAETETRELTDMLTRLVRKKRGVDVTPDFKGKIIRTSIMLIARAEAGGLDISPYVKFARNCARDQIPSLYVAAREAFNISLARTVITELQSLKLFKKSSEPQEFDIVLEGSPVRVYLAVLTSYGTGQSTINLS